MEENLYALDLKILYFINHTLSNAVFDTLMPILRHKLTWIPLYSIIAYKIIQKYKWNGLVILGFGIIAVIMADQISSGLIKPYFQRIRPCNNRELLAWIKLPNGLGTGWSFVSSHASNHFALGLFFAKTLSGSKLNRQILFALMLWATSIAFAQVYIGFHYPSDVILGGLLGSMIGLGMEGLLCKLTPFSYKVIKDKR